MDLITTCLLAYVVLHLLYLSLHDRVVFFFRGNYLYTAKKILEPFARYLSPSLQSTVSIDDAPEYIVKKRLKGIEYLKEANTEKQGVDTMRNTRLIDPRFENKNTLMIFYKGLSNDVHIPNIISGFNSKKNRVVLPSGKELFYLGNNAVHYFSKSFYDDISADIGEKIAASQVKYATTTLNEELLVHSERLCKLTKMDHVRYCTSGSEAVDAAIKDVRRTTGKDIIVRFTNAYHGHSTGLTFGSTNMVYLEEMSPASIKFLEDYHYRIAGVIVNPMQGALVGPNKMSPPGEKMVLGKRVFKKPSREDYAKWLHQVQQRCNYCTKFLTPMAFIVDDVYFAFRSKEIFSWNYFIQMVNDKETVALQPDIVVLGKGIAAGFPLSVVAGKKKFMGFEKNDKGYFLSVNTTVGTFSAWQGGIIASNLLLDKMFEEITETSFQLRKNIKNIFSKANAAYDKFVVDLNKQLQDKECPIRLRNFANTFSINYMYDSVYNSLFPQYLAAQGVFLSNQTVGKFNLQAVDESDYLEELQSKFVAAALKMKEHGWYFDTTSKVQKNVKMKFAAAIVKTFFVDRYEQIMTDKHIDISVSHNHSVNRWGHFWSSVGMICYSYPALFMGYPIKGFMSLLFTHMIRQAGHFFYERQDEDFEKQKFGHKDPSKKFAAAGILIAIVCFFYKQQLPVLSYLSDEEYIVICGLMTVFPHYVEITHKYGWVRGIDWIIKILTDPFTDIPDFYKYAIIHPKLFFDVRSRNVKYDFNIEKKLL